MTHDDVDEDEDAEDDPGYEVFKCPNCKGSGEGPADGTTCQRCKGWGEVTYRNNNEDEDDGCED
jgi:hypothetical protein